MNERITADDLITIPVAFVDPLTALVGAYLELAGGEPSVIRELVISGVIESGIQAMSRRLEDEANRQYGIRMGWPLVDEEEMGT